MDNLPELRDIHLPDGVSVFPLSYGWWLIIFIILLAPYLVHLLLQIHRAGKKLYALRFLSNISTDNPVIFAIKVSELLKRICLHKYPEAVNLFGNQWIEFLNRHTEKALEKRAGDLLKDAPYIAKDSKSYGEEEVNELRRFCVKWIGENL